MLYDFFAGVMLHLVQIILLLSFFEQRIDHFHIDKMSNNMQIFIITAGNFARDFWRKEEKAFISKNTFNRRKYLCKDVAGVSHALL